MPVSFSVAPHSADSVNLTGASEGYSAQEILTISCKQQSKTAGEILQFSFSSEADAGLYVSSAHAALLVLIFQCKGPRLDLQGPKSAAKSQWIRQYSY
jgi:hypothetical protein